MRFALKIRYISPAPDTRAIYRGTQEGISRISTSRMDWWSRPRDGQSAVIRNVLRMIMTELLRKCVAVVTMLLLVGCSSSANNPLGDGPAASPDGTPGEDGVPGVSTEAPGGSGDVSEEPGDAPAQRVTTVGYTYQQPDGNRVVAGAGALPGAESVEIPLSGVPEWVVAAPTGEGSIWAVALADGRVLAFEVVGREVTELDIEPDRLPSGSPPLLVVDARGRPRLVNVLDRGASVHSSPSLLNPEGRLVYIEDSGNLVVREGDKVFRLPVDALPDARVLVDEDERVLLLTEPTGRYGHGVLGDAVEAVGIALVQTRPALQVVLRISIPAPLVIEGIAPLWTDLTGDGRREIIVTLSDAEQGARIAVFSETGEQLAAGPAIGRGFRWRHQLAVARFGAQDGFELVSVRTPHIGGTVEFFRLTGDVLEITAQESGYTSHVLGSRNLDMALAGDFDGDGQTELLLPDQGRNMLGAVRRTADGAETAWQVAAGGQISTNLAAVTLADGRMVLGVGHDGAALQFWLP